MSLRGDRRIVWGGLALVVVVVAVVAGVLLTRGGSKAQTVAGDVGGDVSLTRPTAEPIPPDTTPSETPQITPQATGLKEQRIPESQGGGGVPPSSGGCDHDYGEATQCVPWTFPDGITEYADKCLWLKLNGFTTTLKVVGTDRQRLDPDGNKIACDG